MGAKKQPEPGKGPQADPRGPVLTSEKPSGPKLAKRDLVAAMQDMTCVPVAEPPVEPPSESDVRAGKVAQRVPLVIGAMKQIVEISQGRVDGRPIVDAGIARLRMDAAALILDRLLGKATQAVDLSTDSRVTVDVRVLLERAAEPATRVVADAVSSMVPPVVPSNKGAARELPPALPR
jgi:hypothetical protein